MKSVRAMSVSKKMLVAMTVAGLVFVIAAWVGKTVYVAALEKEQQHAVAEHLQGLYEKELRLKEQVGEVSAVSIASSKALAAALNGGHRSEAVEILKDVAAAYKEGTDYKNIRIHLSDAEGRSYYRSWEPERFGDALGVRSDLREVRKKMKPVKNIVADSKGIGLSSIAPVVYEGRYLGAVDFLQGLNSIQKHLKKNGVDFLFLVEKKRINASGRVAVGEYLVNQKNFDDAFAAAAGNLDFARLGREGFAVDGNYFYTAIPVKDAEGVEVGIYLLGEDQHVAYQSIEETTALMNVALGAAVGLTVLMMMLVGVIQQLIVMRPVSRSVESLVMANVQVVSAAGEISSSSQSLAEGASQQAGNIDQVSSTVEEATAINRQNAENAHEADALAKDAKEAASAGFVRGGELMQAMEEITASSERIAKIIKTVDEIASQTKLLALNAAVEAARAGEHGLGFAVVADEVKSLAQRSANAATETAEIIEKSIAQIKNGLGVASRTSSAFGEILEKINKTSSLLGEISVATLEQSEGMNQIATAMGSIDQVTQQNAAVSEEAAAAAEQLNAQAVAMQEMVGQIAVLIGYDLEEQRGFGAGGYDDARDDGAALRKRRGR